MGLLPSTALDCRLPSTAVCPRLPSALDCCPLSRRPQAAGLSNPTVGTLLASGVNLLAMLLAVPLMETVGRKKLLLVGIQGMLASSLLLSAVLAAKAAALAVPSALLNFLAVSAILAFVSAFEVGPGPIPWQIGGEIFPEAPRATAMSFAATVNWLCNVRNHRNAPPCQQNRISFGSSQC